MFMCKAKTDWHSCRLHIFLIFLLRDLYCCQIFCMTSFHRDVNRRWPIAASCLLLNEDIQYVYPTMLHGCKMADTSKASYRTKKLAVEQ